MATIEAEAVVEQIDARGNQHGLELDAGITQQTGGNVSSPETSPITVCGSYKEAKYLAAARRRSGDIATRHAYAVYFRSCQSWCVK